MHTTVGVIIVEPQSNQEATIEAARQLLMKYDSNRAVPPYRDYPDEAYVTQLLKNRGVRSLEELAEKGFHGDGGEEGDIDEKGLYFISTQNPDGRYDTCSYLDGPVAITADIFSNEKYACGDILTPDGELHSGPITYRGSLFTRRRKQSKWSETLHSLAQSYKGHFLVLFDCHS